MKNGHKFWFSVQELVVLLGYKNPKDAMNLSVPHVPFRAWKQWGDFNPTTIRKEQVPSYWKSDTFLISEGGLYSLICKSTKTEAILFERWLFDEILPKLHEASQCKIETLFQEQLGIKDGELMKLRVKMLELYNKVIVKAFNEESE